MSYRKKLIEVALPLEAINRESAREKSIRHGHPSTLHLWWARRPLAACRAVLFSSIVDDPSSRPEEFPTEEDQERERQRLFRIIEELVKWESSNDERVLRAAREEILKSTDANPPPVLDPFCGGGSIPLEAQRLGLEAHASDLNPVAVLITKALVEIPPRFAGKPPVNPEARERFDHAGEWPGAQGLAEDVRYYGRWMRDEAERRIGHLYPKTTLPDRREAKVIAWLWARTVTCPNPACGAEMPLISSFKLTTKAGKERFIRPVIDVLERSVRFDVAETPPPMELPKVGRGARFRCIVCREVADEDWIKSEGRSGRMGTSLMAAVADGGRGRVYVAPTRKDEEIAARAEPEERPDEHLAHDPRNLWCIPYGLTRYGDLFTPRQLVALTTFAALVPEVCERVRTDSNDVSYANAVATYLGLAASSVADDVSSLVTWRPTHGTGAIAHTFKRQVLPMVWDFAEANPFGGAAGDMGDTAATVANVLDRLPASGYVPVDQVDAAHAVPSTGDFVVCTDPPYYDNIAYADLSDFFYVWLRRGLRDIHPDLFSTLVTPKGEELVASPYRFEGGRKAAEDFFEHGLRETFRHARAAQHSDYPLTLFYAFKQAESRNGAVASTGWETMLTALLEEGFSVTGTWPMRTERSGRSISIGTAALASSIVLVCRPRAAEAPLATRREFVAALRSELPEALRTLQHGSIAPVDLAQAAIGPGMAIFSRHAKVVEADGSPMTVRTALGLINATLDEILAEQEGDFDSDTRFAVSWFEHRGAGDGPYGEADVLARAKNTSVRGMEEAGVLISHGGKVSLLGRKDLRADWDPAMDRRLTIWEVTQHLMKRLEEGGEDAAGDLLRRVGGLGESARELAYRLYTTCERKGWAQEALAYNSLVIAWPEIAGRVPGTPEAAAQESLEL